MRTFRRVLFVTSGLSFTLAILIIALEAMTPVWISPVWIDVLLPFMDAYTVFFFIIVLVATGIATILCAVLAGLNL